ncbi:MAG TPA: ABC transporter permease [Vicinamibacterales bacterium]|nr:ABC transporter permease [Vicinamibacterales bacterium]
MALFQGLVQSAAVTGLNLRTIAGRLPSSAVAVVGMAGVVGVLVAVLSMAEGFRQTMANTGAEDTVVVMRTGTDEVTSILLREDLDVIRDAEEIARGPRGPLASAELFVVLDLVKDRTGTTGNAPLRGVDLVAFQVRQVRMAEGRMFVPGRNEIVVGRAARREYRGLGIGSTVRVGPSDMTVVGAFDAGGTVPDSELWCDAGVLAPLFQRGSSRQSVYAKLRSVDAFSAFKDRLTTDPRVKVTVMREREYYESQSRFVHSLITGLGTVIAVLMGIGAVFAAVNTMYSAVAARTREIATLRAIGFGAGPVMVSVLVESMLLALIGGAVGGAIAYVGFNGYQAATINWQSMSTIAFAFRVTPALLLQGLAYSLVLGFLGGVLPAIRAARLPVVVALREL